MIVRRRGAGAVDERRLSRWAGGVDCQVRRGKRVGEAGWGYVWGGVRGHCRWVQGGQWACDGGRGLEGVEGRDQQRPYRRRRMWKVGMPWRIQEECGCGCG